MAVATFQGVVVSVDVPEWRREAAAVGMAAIGAAVTGAVAIGTAAIGTVITVTIMLSSSATSAFPVGGAGVGVGAVILTGATPIMDTMIMVTRTVTTATGMAINIPATDTTIMAGTAMEIVANTRLLHVRK